MASSLDDSVGTGSDVGGACRVSYFLPECSGVVEVPASDFPPSYCRGKVIHANCASLLFCGRCPPCKTRFWACGRPIRRLTIDRLSKINGQGASAAAEPYDIHNRFRRLVSGWERRRGLWPGLSWQSELAAKCQPPPDFFPIRSLCRARLARENLLWKTDGQLAPGPLPTGRSACRSSRKSKTTGLSDEDKNSCQVAIWASNPRHKGGGGTSNIKISES